MGFLVSPGVDINEIDLTNVIPAVSTSIGAYAGQFTKGPVGVATLISSEKELADTFGSPSKRGDASAASFLTAASFLKYGNALFVSRCKPSGLINASSGGGHSAAFYASEDSDDTDFDQTDSTLTNDVYAADAGLLGNSLKVELVHRDNTSFSDVNDANVFNVFNSDPGTSTWADARGIQYDEVNIVVIDEDGDISGTQNKILESYEGLSIVKDAKKSDGTSNFVCDVINRNSNYVRIPENAFGGVFDIEGDSDGGFSATTVGAFGQTLAQILEESESDSEGNSEVDIRTTAATPASDLQLSLTGGVDGTSTTATDSEIIDALQLFRDPEKIDINLLFSQTAVNADSQDNIADEIQSICEARKDCIGFVSPNTGVSAGATNIKSFFDDNVSSSSYLVLDSSPLYVYNRYADENLYIPACGHMAGLCARTDDTNDPWFSPAGFNRGQLLGVTKVKFNPKQADRDLLYKARINPIVSFPGEGIVLFGDKTAQTKPSAFDRINVRRLFIVLEKAISTAAKYQLFELNDEFTRAMFRNMVEPFLRDVKGRRGVTDFLVVCDETNNTAEVIDGNRFVADIYIKPARSINFITLNFIATRTGVEFSEIAGASA
jgi:phage tail sheath protein FI